MALRGNYELTVGIQDFEDSVRTSAFLLGLDFDADQLAELLNAQGAEGWELVSVFDIDRVKGGSKFVIAVMKRPKG